MSDRTITLSSGITCRVLPMQPLFYQAFIAKLNRELPMPEVPKILVPTIDNPDGEYLLNPDDPDYARALQERQNAYGDKLLEALIVMGLGVDLPKDGAWLRRLRYLGIEIDDSPEGMQVAYVRNVVLTSVKDIENITNAVLNQVTVTEGAVEESTASFRS